MSFSADTKAELCRTAISRPCCAVAEAYGVLLFAYAFSAREIRIITGSAPFARRLPRLMKKAFGLDFDEHAEGAKRTFTITAPEKIRRIFETFGYDAEKVAQAVEEARSLPGIGYVRVWLNEGELALGDDIMLVLIGGDIRPRVVDALQSLVSTIKNECVSEQEITD